MRSPVCFLDRDDGKLVGALARHTVTEVDAAARELCADASAVVVVADGAEVGRCAGPAPRTPPAPSPSGRRMTREWLLMRIFAVGLSARGDAGRR